MGKREPKLSAAVLETLGPLGRGDVTPEVCEAAEAPGKIENLSPLNWSQECTNRSKRFLKVQNKTNKAQSFLFFVMTVI